MFFQDFAVGSFEGTRYRIGGSGPPLLLLHGNPQTHAMWHRVAPDLARRFTVIAADIRGYGFSAKPGVSADHAPYSKREMAKDVVGLMRGLGFERFSIVSHDRGARLAHRIALWDVLASCTIVGASDASIADPVPNDLRRVASVARLDRLASRAASG